MFAAVARTTIGRIVEIGSSMPLLNRLFRFPFLGNVGSRRCEAVAG